MADPLLPNYLQLASSGGPTPLIPTKFPLFFCLDIKNCRHIDGIAPLKKMLLHTVGLCSPCLLHAPQGTFTCLAGFHPHKTPPLRCVLRNFAVAQCSPPQTPPCWLLWPSLLGWLALLHELGWFEGPRMLLVIECTSASLAMHVRRQTRSEGCLWQRGLQVSISLLMLTMMIPRTQTHLHQPWRLDTCKSFIHSLNRSP